MYSNNMLKLLRRWKRMDELFLTKMRDNLKKIKCKECKKFLHLCNCPKEDRINHNLIKSKEEAIYLIDSLLESFDIHTEELGYSYR